MPERLILLGAAVVYGLPLAGLLAGALAGSLMTGSDGGAFVGAVAGIGVVFMLTPAFRRRVERSVLGRVVVRRLA